MIVRVGLPSIRNPMPQKTQDTIEALKNYDKALIDFRVYRVQGTHCVRARNIAAMDIPRNSVAPVKQHISYDYYLAMDDDMAFTPEAIERLIAADKDIIGAAYPTRDSTDNKIVAVKAGGRYCREDWFTLQDHGIQECEWTGAGCLLIKKKVFEAMDYPYFRNNLLFIEVNGVMMADVCTEDISFCADARKAGFKIYVDLDNRVEPIST